MTATCPVGAMLYVLPMLLGRTYDMNSNTVGIDIFDQRDIDNALHHPIEQPYMVSSYTQIENFKEKRDSLGVSAELALKISSGLLDIKGSGDYLRATSQSDKNFEILVKAVYETVFRELDTRAEPIPGWDHNINRDTLGTHVVKSIRYGGELYASINFVALKDEYMEEIKGTVRVALRKSGAFDFEAEGALNMLNKNLSSKAKIEIDYYSTVPLDSVPTTIHGLIGLVQNFSHQVERVNHGNGVPICVEFESLGKWDRGRGFHKDPELETSLNHFSDLYNELLDAKALLKNMIRSLPENTPSEYMHRLIEFSTRLMPCLSIFHDTIANLDLQKGTYQLDRAIQAFDENKRYPTENELYNNAYTEELKYGIGRLETKDLTFPRGIFTEWGSKTCSNTESVTIYSGTMVGHLEQAVGGGSEYICLPDHPDMAVAHGATKTSSRSAKLAGVRYHSMSVFEDKHKHIDNQVVPCAVCESTSRPTVEMIPGLLACPSGWTKEYAGFLVSTTNDRARGEFVCVSITAEVLESGSEAGMSNPIILPVMVSTNGKEDVDSGETMPCFVCSR